MMIAPGTWQDELAALAEKHARGDLRTAMAMLLGTYVQLVGRHITAEHTSDDWLRAAVAFCQAGAAKLGDSATFYARGDSCAEERRALYMGKLHNVRDEGAAFATYLRERFDTLGICDPEPDDRSSEDPAPTFG